MKYTVVLKDGTTLSLCGSDAGEVISNYPNPDEIEQIYTPKGV